MRCALSVSGEIPPTVVNESSPFSSMFVTVTPTSSMCPTSAIVAASLCAARTRANEVPSVSEVTSANAEAASRQTRVGSSSCPDGPRASRSACKKVGGLHTLEHSSRSA